MKLTPDIVASMPYDKRAFLAEAKQRGWTVVGFTNRMPVLEGAVDMEEVQAVLWALHMGAKLPRRKRRASSTETGPDKPKRRRGRPRKQKEAPDA